MFPLEVRAETGLPSSEVGSPHDRSFSHFLTQYQRVTDRRTNGRIYYTVASTALGIRAVKIHKYVMRFQQNLGAQIF